VSINLRPMKTYTALAAALVVFLGTTTAFAAHHKLSPELNDKLGNLGSNVAGQQPNGLVDVIIQFKPGTKLDSGITKVTGGGGQHKSRLDVINGSLFSVPVGLLSKLAEDPDVIYISPNRQTIKMGKIDKILDATNTTSIINLGYTGDNIGVAVIDSGVKASHPDFSNQSNSNGGYNGSRVVYSQSFIPGLDASDQYGHGTHVAGLIAGNGSVSGQWMVGVASRADIVNLRVLDANGAGTDSAVIAAIQRAIQLKGAYNIRIINLSLGRAVAESYTLDPLCQAVEQAWKAGIVVVVAAGNNGRDNTMNTNGYGTITAPGNDPYVITVGAINTHATDYTYDDTMTSYSSKGPTLFDHVVKPDLVAPGNRVVSLLASGSTLDTLYPTDELSPSLYGGYSYSASYTYMSGTSMAAPIVSGAVALMLQYMPNLTPDQVKARLMMTATKMPQSYGTEQGSNGSAYNTQYDVFTVGAGILDTYDAMAANGNPYGTALSPIATLDSSGNVLLQADPSSVWSNSVTWGESVVWGNGLLVNGTSVIWGNSVVWGNSTMVGNSVIWGNSVTWGNALTGAYSEAGDYDKN
jgi:serine protease AprX